MVPLAFVQEAHCVSVSRAVQQCATQHCLTAVSVYYRIGLAIGLQHIQCTKMVTFVIYLLMQGPVSTLCRAVLRSLFFYYNDYSLIIEAFHFLREPE